MLFGTCQQFVHVAILFPIKIGAIEILVFSIPNPITPIIT